MELCDERPHLSKSTFWPGLLKGVTCCTLIPVLALVFLLFVVPWLLDPTSLWNAREFDSLSWREGDVELRVNMIDNLIDSERLIGLTSEQVIELLGEPDGSGEELYFYVDSAIGRGTRVELVQFSDMPDARLSLFVDGKSCRPIHSVDGAELSSDATTVGAAPFELPSAEVWSALSADERKSLLIDIAAAYEHDRLDAARLRGWRPSDRVDEATLMYDLKLARYHDLFIQLVGGQVDHAGAFKPLGRGLID